MIAETKIEKKARAAARIKQDRLVRLTTHDVAPPVRDAFLNRGNAPEQSRRSQ